MARARVTTAIAVLTIGGAAWFGVSPTAAEVINGTAGDDLLTGTPKRDVIDAYGGDDVVNSGRGSDTVVGDDGDDTLILGPGRDYGDGGRDDDILRWVAAGTTATALAVTTSSAGGPGPTT